MRANFRDWWIIQSLFITSQVSTFNCIRHKHSINANRENDKSANELIDMSAMMGGEQMALTQLQRIYEIITLRWSH